MQMSWTFVQSYKFFISSCCRFGIRNPHWANSPVGIIPQPDTTKEVVTIVPVPIVSVTLVVVAIGLSFYCYRVRSSHGCCHL